MARVFVCHASEDVETAREVVAALESAGIGCWLAPRDGRLGDEYAGDIVTAIRACDALLVLLTTRANNSPHVRNEVEIAFGRDKRLVTLRLENIDLHPSLEYFLKSRNWIVAYPPPIAPHVRRLVEDLSRILVPKPKPNKQVELPNIRIDRPELQITDHALSVSSLVLNAPPSPSRSAWRRRTLIGGGLGAAGVAAIVAANLPHGSNAPVASPRPNPIPPAPTPSAAPPPLPAAPKPGPTKPDWAASVGHDAFGDYATIAVPADRGAPVTQRLRRIPAGVFMMGSPPDESGRHDNEGPRHRVDIAQEFWLFDTQCTQALWQAVMGANPSRFQSPTRPVENVSFTDVAEFLDRINRRVPGLNLALPSEAQWEYACRAGTEWATYAGPTEIKGENNAPVLDPIAWYGGNSGVDFNLRNGYDSSGWREKQYPHTRAGTHPVGLKRPNAWGLHDMLGNVWEWCADTWHGGYDGHPADGSAWTADSAAFRVVRGGSWIIVARSVRAAYRYPFALRDLDDIIGFRCARVQA